LIALLAGVSATEMKSLGLESLRNWRRRKAQRHETDPMRKETGQVFQVQGDFGVELVRLLLTRAGSSQSDVSLASAAFADDEILALEWMTPVVEFLGWLVRSGLVRELGCGTKPNNRGYSWDVPRCYATAMRLTLRGVAVLDSPAEDPLLPGTHDRLRYRCPGIPDAVLALFVDAKACLEHALYRPAIVLMGVAYELAIAQVVDALATRNLVKPNTPTLDASDRLKRVLALLDDDVKIKDEMKLSSEERGLAQAAYRFADLLRRRRNEGAHPIPAIDFEHRGETEEFFVSAARYLPGIWLLREDRHDPAYVPPKS
jgi:hypothetical protein